MNRINLETHGLAVIGQPTESDLRKLKEAGVKTVVNLRHAGEDQMPLSIEAEGELVHELGMDYVHLPVSMKPPEEGGADETLAVAFEKVLAAAREVGPVAVHCKLGQRAGAMVLIALGKQRGWDGAAALEAADELGLGGVKDNKKLRGYVETCLGSGKRDGR